MSRRDEPRPQREEQRRPVMISPIPLFFILSALLCVVTIGLFLIDKVIDININIEANNRNSIPTKCPEPEDIQSWFVKNLYNEDQHTGLYYEIAFKDVTQPRICKCITSTKSLSKPNKDLLIDDFGIQCSGHVYHSDLSFDLVSGKRGYMIGKWNNFWPMKGVEFPNTIVDVGLNPWTGGKYDWVIEFQCKQGSKIFNWQEDWIQYYGINFYSREYDDRERLEDMIQAARSRGLGPFLDSGLDLFIVDHENCIEDH